MLRDRQESSFLTIAAPAASACSLPKATSRERYFMPQTGVGIRFSGATKSRRRACAAPPCHSIGQLNYRGAYGSTGNWETDRGKIKTPKRRFGRLGVGPDWGCVLLNEYYWKKPLFVKSLQALSLSYSSS